MGSPDFAVPSLEALVAAGHEVIAAYAQPPRPAGRGKAERKTAVHVVAEALEIPVRTPRTLRDPEEQAQFAALDADLAVVAAYGLILPKPILEAPKGGCINVHASLLPRWRGAAPIQRAILAGDEVTGVTIMRMDEGLDTGPMLLKRELGIRGRNAGQVADELAKLGASALVEWLAHPTPGEEQPAVGATYASKVDKAEARIDWSKPAAEIERQVLAFIPAPVAYFEVSGERVRVLGARAIDRWPDANEVPGAVIDRIDAQTNAPRPSSLKRGEGIAIACGQGYLEPIRLQRPGRQPIFVAEFLRGFAIPKGTILK